jgi:hypothetical protein
LKGEPVGDLAASAAVKTLEWTITARKEAAASGDMPGIGMLMRWKLTPDGSEMKKLCVRTYNGPAYLFTIEAADGGQRIVAAENLGSARCDQ